MQHNPEIIIVGGGPAGLSAALIAGRAGQRALLVDGGTPRNAAAPAMHSFVSRDGVLPRDFRAAAHAELRRYASVERRDGLVEAVQGGPGGFDVALAGGARFTAPRVMLALGMVDTLPAIPGLAERWGRGVHHCPFCDGFEHRGEPWGVLADDPAMLEHALFLRGWAGSVTIFTSGHDTPPKELAAVEAAGLRIVRAPVARVVGGEGHSLQGIELQGGSIEPVESFWIRPKQAQAPLVQALGLRLRDDGAIWRDDKGQTSQPGIYAVGDCASGPMQQAILAAADGARTMFPIIRELVLGAGSP